MPAFTLEATAEGANTEWTLGSGASKTVAVSDSDDGTYIQITGVTSPGRQSFVAQDLPADAVGITPPVTCNARGKDVSATNDLVYSHFRYSAANYEDATGWDFSTSVAAYTRDWANAPGGGSWTPAILNACEIGVYRAGTTNTVMVMKYNVTGNYYQAGACFIPILSLMFGLIGAGLSAADMPALARFIFDHRRMPGGARVLIRPDEYREALESWRRYLSPRYAFLTPAACGY
jgi:hypothetical protein